MQSKKAKKKDINTQPYPYLSINQNNKLQINKQCDPFASLDYLNIKLDKKFQLRQTYFNSFKSKVLGSITRNSKDSISDSQQKKQLPRILMKKTLMNPEQVIQASTAKVRRQLHVQNSIGHKRRVSSHDYKKPMKIKEQIKQADHNNTTTIPKYFSFHQENTAQHEKPKPKKHLFKKMLKKCDKLIQISKFESQLIHTVQTKEENALRIHSEPVTLVEYKTEHEDKMQQNKRKDKMYVMLADYHFDLMKMKPEDFLQNKSLQIRKYSQEIQKMKNAFRKQLTKHQLSKPKNKNSPEKASKSNLKEHEIFGPWEAINQSFCLSRD